MSSKWVQVVPELTGRELDAAVAERVMGWPVITQPNNPDGNDDWFDSLSFPCLILHPAGGYFLQRSALITDECGWRPSTDISAAMLVVEKMRADGWTFELEAVDSNAPWVVSNRDKQWMAAFDDDARFPKPFGSYNATPAEAICRAALTAVGDQGPAQVGVEPKEREPVIGDDGGPHVSFSEPCATVVK